MMTPAEAREFLRSCADAWPDADVVIAAHTLATGSPSALIRCGAERPAERSQEHPHVAGVVVYTPENEPVRGAVLAAYRAVDVAHGRRLPPPQGGTR